MNFFKLVMLSICAGMVGSLLFLLACPVAHGATTSKKNSLGSVSYQNNPYVYQAVGHILEVHNVEGNLSLRVNPLYTYMLYDENVLLCGLPIDKFGKVFGAFLMTYERQAHRSVNGVGCHELLKVDPIVGVTQ